MFIPYVYFILTPGSTKGAFRKEGAPKSKKEGLQFLETRLGAPNVYPK